MVSPEYLRQHVIFKMFELILFFHIGLLKDQFSGPNSLKCFEAAVLDNWRFLIYEKGISIGVG